MRWMYFSCNIVCLNLKIIRKKNPLVQCNFKVCVSQIEWWTTKIISERVDKQMRVHYTFHLQMFFLLIFKTLYLFQLPLGIAFSVAKPFPDIFLSLHVCS